MATRTYTRDSKGRFASAGGAKVKVDVDTKDAQKNLKDLKKSAQDAKKELSGFDKVVNSAFGARNVFQVTNFNRALTAMVDTVKSVSFVLVGANVAIVTFFSAIVKELNKLQGFLSIMTLSTKSTADANKQFEFLRNSANQLGIDLNALTSNYAKLTAAIPDGNEKFSIAQKLFTGLAMAARTLHASTLDTQLMFYAVTQMASKGVISMEELRRQLGERLPGAMEIAARALNTTTQALEKAIRTGNVQSTPFLKFFGDELIRTFAASADIAANTVDAALNRLRNVWVDFVKSVLDSGAGQAIVNVFDALREKLSDPFVMATFSTMIGELATKVANFVKSLTSTDITNAFATLKGAIELIVEVTLELIRALTWLMNNSKAIGAAVGAMAGAGKGASIGFMLGGPKGAAIGAAIGGGVGFAGGMYVGSQLAVDPYDVSAFAGQKAEIERQAKERQRMQGVMLQSIMGSLSQLGFSSSDQSHILPMIEKRLGFNAESAAMYAKIFNKDKNAGVVYQNLQQQQAAALELAMYGRALGPRGQLEDVLGSGKGEGKKGRAKKDPTLPKSKVNDLAEGERYIEMLQRQLVKEEELLEVEKLWRAVGEGRVKFNSMANFEKAKGLATILDELKATNALVDATNALSDAYTDNTDALQDRLNQGLMTSDELMKSGMLRDFDSKIVDEISKIPEHFKDARDAAWDMAGVLRKDLSLAIDQVIERSRSFSYGWEGAMIKYTDDVTNYAKTAGEFFDRAVGGMEDAFVEFATTGKLSFRSLIDAMLADLARFSVRWLMMQAMTGMRNAFSPGGMFWSDNGLAGGDGFVVSGTAGYAAGGNVFKNRPIWVGENGKELFTPPTNGRIIPNHEIGGAVSQPISITYHIGSIGSNVSRQDIAVALDQTRRTTIAEIRDMSRRNATVLR